MTVSHSSMRVTHVVPALFGRNGVVGGAERYALELARAMADRVPTALVTFGDAPVRERRGELEIRVLGPSHYVRGQRSNPFHVGLAGELRRADVVHCHQQHIVASSAAAVFCRLTGRRVVVTDLGGGGWDVSGYISTDRWYHAHLHLSAYSRRISGHDDRPWAHLVYGGVDTERFAPSDDSAGAYVLYVGRLLPHKGVDVLIEAIPRDMPLLIVGAEGDERYVRDLRRLADGKRVTFRRDASDVDLVRVYQDALCIVLPSVYRSRYGSETRVPELLGQTLLEGMACGLPTVATDVASLPEVVTHERTGFLVPPNDAQALRARLTWLHEHREEARRMGREARDEVTARFTWPAVVRRCLAAYASPVSR